MPKKVKDPIVVPSKPEKLYDEVWIPYLQVVSANPNAPVRATLELRKVGVVEGRKEFAPATTGAKAYGKMVIDDLFAVGIAEPTLGAAISTLIDEITKYAEKKGVL